MKRILLTLLLVLVWVAPLVGDVIPENTHPVSREVYLTNLNDFPEMVLVSYVTGPMIQDYEATVIEQNTPLSKGYKFNQLQLFAVKKTIVDQLGGIDRIDFAKIAEQTPPADIVDPGTYFVPEDNPVSADRYYYKITETTETILNLQLDHRVISFNNGRADELITY
jgi:hypothetical protein